MYERDEVLQDLHGRLVAAGINPLDPKVQAICEIVNAFYAEKTRDVLEKMQACWPRSRRRRVGLEQPKLISLRNSLRRLDALVLAAVARAARQHWF